MYSYANLVHLAAAPPYVYGVMLLSNALAAGMSLMIACGVHLREARLSYLATLLCVAAGDSLNDSLYYWLGYWTYRFGPVRAPLIATRLGVVAALLVGPTLWMLFGDATLLGIYSPIVFEGLRPLDVIRLLMVLRTALRCCSLERNATTFIAEENAVALGNPLAYFLKQKISYGVGFIWLMAAGASRFPYAKYALACGYISLAQAAAFLPIGKLMGSAVGSQWSYAIVATFVIVRIVYPLRYQIRRNLVLTAFALRLHLALFRHRLQQRLAT